MNNCADLEIYIRRKDADSYSIDFRFLLPNSDGETRLISVSDNKDEGRSPTAIQIDRAALAVLGNSYDDNEYGKLLSESLFHHEAMKSGFQEAVHQAQAADAPLRVRLLIAPDCPELYSLQWERLSAPNEDKLLFVGEQLFFSRYLSSFDWQPVRLRAKSELTAFLAVANPSDLKEYKLAEIKVAAETERAENALGDIAVITREADKHCTLNHLTENLRNHPDIFYLVCHGTLHDGEPYLLLEDDQGEVSRVKGGELITRMKELRQKPRLIVLASCQSAGIGADELSDNRNAAFAALGPRLAEAGVPAVLAMQGYISLETLETFMPVFFTELQKDGQIDRAMAIARGAVRDQMDAWVPVLFMRLKSGCLWYIKGFSEGDRGAGAEKWTSLLASIDDEECTPIIGPTLNEGLLGSRSAAAESMARKNNFPLSSFDRDNLPHVAQYVAVMQGTKIPPREMLQELNSNIQLHAGTEKELTGGKGNRRSSVKALVREMTTCIDEITKSDKVPKALSSCHALAQLPLPLYITADTTDILLNLLRNEGKSPHQAFCPWNDYAKDLPSVFSENTSFRPSPDEPLIYHMFGHISEIRSLVLTEDDYFDYLIGLTGNRDIIPKLVRAALSDSALMFIGFEVEDWDFRVLFRSILGQEGQKNMDEYSHIAVQMTPDEGSMTDSGRAQKYLETYFQKKGNMDVYWGSADEFISELFMKWEDE